VTGFDDPAPGSPSRDLGLVFDFFAAAANVRRQLVLVDEFAGRGVVVCGIETDPLGRLFGWLGAWDRD